MQWFICRLASLYRVLYALNHYIAEISYAFWKFPSNYSLHHTHSCPVLYSTVYPRPHTHTYLVVPRCVRWWTWNVRFIQGIEKGGWGHAWACVCMLEPRVHSRSPAPWLRWIVCPWQRKSEGIQPVSHARQLRLLFRCTYVREMCLLKLFYTLILSNPVWIV